MQGHEGEQVWPSGSSSISSERSSSLSENRKQRKRQPAEQRSRGGGTTLTVELRGQPARGPDACIAALLGQIGARAGHAVYAQRLQLDQHISLHGRPPRFASAASSIPAALPRKCSV